MTRAAVTAAAFAVAAVLAAPAPAASAVPGDPADGCVTYGLGSTAMVCDGPVRPDGSWQRCSSWSQWYVPGAGGDSPGGYVPAGRKCEVVTPETSTAGFWGAPPEHIDG